jgi:predicted nucleic-acid-binding Zn-ribbon protein
MPISLTQQQELSHWLRGKGVREDCPACGAKSRTVGDIIAPPSASGGGGTAAAGPSFPLVQIVCKNCSYVMHFAGTPIGLDSHMENLRQELSHTES